jgi:hypothetical protein
MVEDNNEIDPRESGCKNVSWIELVQDQVQGWNVVLAVLNIQDLSLTHSSVSSTMGFFLAV